MRLSLALLMSFVSSYISYINNKTSFLFLSLSNLTKKFLVRSLEKPFMWNICKFEKSLSNINQISMYIKLKVDLGTFENFIKFHIQCSKLNSFFEHLYNVIENWCWLRSYIRKYFPLNLIASKDQGRRYIYWSHCFAVTIKIIDYRWFLCGNKFVSS